jgi:hypothetical protein
MSEAERASVRSCLDHAGIELATARCEHCWWQTLGSDVRRQYQEAEALVARLRRNLDEKMEVVHID